MIQKLFYNDIWNSIMSSYILSVKEKSKIISLDKRYIKSCQNK